MLSRSLPGQWRLSEMAVIGPAHRETGDKLALVCQRTRDQHLAARHPRRYMAQTGHLPWICLTTVSSFAAKASATFRAEA